MKPLVRPISELSGLTGLRGIAALTVFVAHSRFQDLAPMLRPVFAFFEWHALAVDLFFMLSGFVLVHVYAGKLSLRGKPGWYEYFVARFARVFPLYLITLVAALAVFWIGSCMLKKWPAYITVPTVLTNLLLVQNWPGLFHLSINLASWSLSVELLCYLLLMPVALGFCKWLSWPVTLVLVAVLLSGRALLAGQIDGWVSLGRGATCFLSGALLHRFHRVLPVSGAAMITLFGAVCFMLLRSLVTWAELSPNWPLLSFPFLVVGLSDSAGTLVDRFFDSRIMLWLGDISYSVYLWQGPVTLITHYQIRPRLLSLPAVVQAAWMFAELTILLVLSTFSYRRLELPLRNWLRGMLVQPACSADILPVA